MLPIIARFDKFELDLRAYELRRLGHPMKLERIPMELLLLLVERRGELVTREQIKEKLWGDSVFVDTDNAINTAIRKVRQTLGDDPDEPRFVQTVVGRGYRFVAEVEPVTPQAAADGQAIHAPERAIRRETAATPPLPPAPSGESSRPRRSLALTAIVLGASLLAITAYLVIPALRPKKPVMLAVLPFQNLSGDPEQEYFTDGLTEETITDLGQVSPEKLGVIARTSAMTYKASKKNARQIGEELGVDYILEGSARREGALIRVSAQLIRVKDQTHVWAHSFDRELHEVLGVQSELGQAIAQQVQVSLTPRDRLALTRKRPVNPDAYDLYLRGRYFWNKLTPDGMAKAIAYFQQAVEKDPTYAPAYAGLADCYGTLPIGSDTAPGSSFPLAQAAARKAVELDDSLAEAHVAMVRINLWYEWNWPELEREAHRALALNPNSADAHLRYAHYLSNAGRHKEALEEAQRARNLDPFAPLVRTLQGQFTYYAGQSDLALKELQETVELFPDFWIGHINLGKVYEQKRMYPQAIAEFEKARNLSGSTETLSLAGHAHALSGNRGDALKILGMLEEQAKQRYIPPYNVALIYAGLGNNKQALEWLEKGFEARDVHMVFLGVDPKWNSLRGEPRFQSLVRRIGLAH